MTAVVPEVDIDQDISLFEESDFEIACDISLLKLNDWGFPDCKGEPARWIAWRAGCCPASPRYRLVCDYCKGVYQKWQAKQACIWCPTCGEETGGFIDFTPLRKGS